mmetsp:Transcript_7809/g.14184  ORF Transcript_7809/g.14184 Transcript_7809/m.14184 type:complete len:169 (-) Transcript_7809:159-665(-)
MSAFIFHLNSISRSKGSIVLYASHTHSSKCSSITLQSNKSCKVFVETEIPNEYQQIIEVPRGTKLRTLLINSGVTPHNGASKVICCRGLGTCGTCAVSIVNSDGVVPENRSVREDLRLQFPPHTEGNTESKNLRLSCQVYVENDVYIRKFSGFWGHKNKQVTFNDPNQ